MLLDLWDPMTDDFVRHKKGRFISSGPPMPTNRTFPYTNILYITNLPIDTTPQDIIEYCLPVIPLQVQISPDGTAHVEILRKVDLVNIVLKQGKPLKRKMINLYVNKIMTDAQLIAMAE